MFMKKIVDMASRKPAQNFNGLKEDDVNPRLVFHYGIPSRSIRLACDPIQNILAIATSDGRIKLYGKENTQVQLESNEAAPSKFLQFMENQGILMNVTVQNLIEVWDIDKRAASHVYRFEREITSFTIIQRSTYIYVGDSLGNISVLKLHREPYHLILMKYCLPFAESHGTKTEKEENVAVKYTLPQPFFESKRVLIIYEDGLLILWGIQESKALFMTGGKMQHSSVCELRKVTSACWACSYGSKVVVGYSNGDILIWNMPGALNPKNSTATEKGELFSAQNLPHCKLNLGYKMEKIPIVSLRWVAGDSKSNRLYVSGASGSASLTSFQIIVVNKDAESRNSKLLLPLTEICIDMEIVSTVDDQAKHKHDSLLLLLESGLLCIYDDSEIEKYLMQCLSKSTATIPKQLISKLPFGDSKITVAKFVTEDSCQLTSVDKDEVPAKGFPSLFSVDSKAVNNMKSTNFSGFSKVKNLYITGHSNGVIHFWDATCPLLILLFSLKHQQSEDAQSLSGNPITSLYFDGTSQLLISGDQSGMVCMFKLKLMEPNTASSLLSPLVMKQRSSGVIHDFKYLKLSSCITTISMNPRTGILAVGSDEGYVSIVNMETMVILSQRRFMSDVYAGIISLQPENHTINGFEKNLLFVALKDSSVLALEEDTGNALSSSMIRSKKPCRALFMQILGGTDLPALPVKDTITQQSLLLICSENDVRLYSLAHVIQGTKKVHSKKKFHSTCFYAATFCNRCSSVGLILLFTSGKFEIRSLPDLSLLREASITGFRFPSLSCEVSVSSSSEGEVLLVNGDQEIFFLSSLSRNDEVYMHLEFLRSVFKRNVVRPFTSTSGKEKTKGIFSAVIKEMKGCKEKHVEEAEPEESDTSIEDQLSAIFSTSNFPSVNEHRHISPILDEDDIELGVDDIDLEESTERPKGYKVISLNKEKLNNRFHAIKGKFLPRKGKSTSSSMKEVHDDVKGTDTIDQIKKKYGFQSLSDNTTDAKMTDSKLRYNLEKLEGINTRTTEMRDTAKSFSALAQRVLKTAEQEGKE